MSNYLKRQTEGVELFYQIDKAERPKANIVINHGFAEHIGRYDYVVKRLVSEGYNTLRYDLRGHGHSKGRIGHIDSYQDFISDADAMVEVMKDSNPNLPTYMLGHSLGGLITTLYGIKYPDKLQGQVLSGAANGKLPGANAIMAKGLSVIAKLFPKKYLKNPVGDDLCSVEEVVTDYMNDPLVLKSATFNFYNEFFNKATDNVLNRLKDYNLPVLILHGESDTIVPPELSENLYNSISSNDKEIVIYPGLFHEIFNETKKDQVIDKVIDWLNIRVKE